MRTHLRTGLAVVGLAAALGVVGTLSLPTSTAAYSLIGGNLSLSQRDFRVFNNFTDSQANNNTVPHPNFPGQTGAPMAIWKGHVEWASGPVAGNGLGDGLAGNAILGSGEANFDNTFQGLHDATGGTNGNVHSELSGSSGGVLAFTETPISDGWRIRYYSGWTWQDGPAGVSSGIDLQGVACHEIGHSLGLGHSTASGATMRASISGTGTGQRSINSDDQAGIQAIYGAKSASKPEITSISGDTGTGGILNITGVNFSNSNNEVWFTDINHDGTPVKVTNVSSTSGGTQIAVSVPAGIQDGDVLVKNNGSGHANLSNAWPIDIGAPAGDPPTLTSINPTSGPAGGFTVVTLTGSGFTGTSNVTFGGASALGFSVDSPTQITATTPGGAALTTVDVTVFDPEGSSTLSSAFFYTGNPAPSISSVTPNEGDVNGGDIVTVSGLSVLGVTDVQFGGISGMSVDVIDPQTLEVETPAGVAPGTVDVTAFGNGTSTIVGGFTYVDEGQFIDIGPGVAGSLGEPVLSGSGDLTPGSSEGFSLVAANALPNGFGTMFVAIGDGLNIPFKGGTFYPAPILLQIPVAMNLFGIYSLSTSIPVGTPSDLALVFQVWIADGGAVQGASGTNGLQAIVP